MRARVALDRLSRRPVDDIPFDQRRGVIANDGGRVCDLEGRRLPGEYVVGWIKRGPSGVIGTNKKDSADTVSKIVADAEAGSLGRPWIPIPKGSLPGWPSGCPTRSRGPRGRRSTSTSAASGNRTAARASSSFRSPSWWRHRAVARPRADTDSDRGASPHAGARRPGLTRTRQRRGRMRATRGPNRALAGSTLRRCWGMSDQENGARRGPERTSPERAQ